MVSVSTLNDIHSRRGGRDDFLLVRISLEPQLVVWVGIELVGVVDRQLMAGAASMVLLPLWWDHGSAMKGVAMVTRRSVCLVHCGLQVAMEAEMPTVLVQWTPQE